MDESSTAREIDLPTGETLEIRLRENRSAGFRWRLVGRLPKYLTAEDEFLAPTPASPPGTSGVHVWKLKGTGEGSANIEFEYVRSWEGTDKTPRKFGVTVRVGA
jgi:predicted secreted protein